MGVNTETVNKDRISNISLHSVEKAARRRKILQEIRHMGLRKFLETCCKYRPQIFYLGTAIPDLLW